MVERFIEFYTEHKEMIWLPVISGIIGMILERLLGITKIPMAIYKHRSKVKEKESKMMQQAIDEIHPMLQKAEEALEEIENQIIQEDIMKSFFYSKAKIKGLEELQRARMSINEHIGRVNKPRNIRKRLKRMASGKMKRIKYFEEVYFINSMFEAIEMLLYGLLANCEEEIDIKDEIENLEIEISKSFNRIREFERKYSRYIKKYRFK